MKFQNSHSNGGNNGNPRKQKNLNPDGTPWRLLHTGSRFGTSDASQETIYHLGGDERTKAVIESIQRHAVERLDFAFDSDFDEIDTNSLESIRTIIQEKLTDVDSATPQLVGILERITVVLEKLQHPTPNNDVNALAAMLEKAAIAMQPPPEQKAITGETEENTDARGEHRLASSPTRTDEAD